MSHLGGTLRCMTPEQHAIRVAASQHGLISRPHATMLGVTEKQLQHLLQLGRWRAVRPGVYAVGGIPVTTHMTLLAAGLAAGADAVASHRAAAWLWGFEGFSTAPTELTVASNRGPGLADVIVHHSKRFDPVDRTTFASVPVTTRERTIIDLGAVVRPYLVETALHHYLRTGGTLRKLEWRLDEIGGRGCRGVGV